MADLIGTRFSPRRTLPLRSLSATDSDEGLARADQYDFVHGHVPFATRDAFRITPFTLTILRDPVERSVSAYHYLIQTANADPGHPTRAVAADFASRHTLLEFARSDFGARHNGNRQVGLLTQSYRAGHFTLRGTNPFEPTEADLDLAKANLEACDVFGLTERLQDTVDLLALELGVASLGTVGTANATIERPAIETLDADTLAILRERAALDIELHRFAVDLFEQRRRTARRAVDGAIDAQRPSECRFDDVIPGDGWYTPEQHGDRPYSWTGPHPTSTLELATPPGADGGAVLEVDVVHTILHDPFDGLVLQINGRQCDWDVVPGAAPPRLVAAVPSDALRPTGATNLVGLTVRATARPSDVWVGNADSRSLGIAVGRVALLPGGPR